MARVLIVYGTVEGQTEKISREIADQLRQKGHRADLMKPSFFSTPRSIDPRDYDSVVIGGPVYASCYPRALRRWVKANAHELSQRPSAFFSVCLGVLQKSDPQAQESEEKVLQDFFRWSGWRPQTWTLFAGALPYTKYNWLKRRLMKAIIQRAGGDTDTSRDYEYTDWDEVRRFAQRVESLQIPPGIRRAL